MSARARARRFAIAGIALTIALAAFRSQIADALVLRGDAMLYRNQLTRARAMYARALEFDASSAAAADRYVFISLEQRTYPSLQSAILVASKYLHLHPLDPSVMADRALCYLLERRYVRAQRDFERLARETRDPRYAVFAGWAALRTGNRAHAIAWWKDALREHPSYRPALDALKEAQR